MITLVGVHVFLKIGRIDRRLDLLQGNRLGNRLGCGKHLACEKQLPDQTMILRRHRERRCRIELIGKARHAAAALAIESRLRDFGRHRKMLDEGVHADLRIFPHLFSRHCFDGNEPLRDLGMSRDERWPYAGQSRADAARFEIVFVEIGDRKAFRLQL